MPDPETPPESEGDAKAKPAASDGTSPADEAATPAANDDATGVTSGAAAAAAIAAADFPDEATNPGAAPSMDALADAAAHFVDGGASFDDPPESTLPGSLTLPPELAALAGTVDGTYAPQHDPGILPTPPPPAAPPLEDETDGKHISDSRLPSVLESLLLAADRPLLPKDLVELTGEPDASRIGAAMQTLVYYYATRGVQLHEVAGGWQFRTAPENAPWVQKMLATKPVRLTRAQLETLAIVSYRQPITRPEIDDIRGVDSGGTLKTLLDRSLVRILGKKEEVGRPMLYGTTREFLEFFHLRDLKDLPTLREFHELSGEHAAQVAALEAAAPPNSIEPQSGVLPGTALPGTPIPVGLPELARTDLRDDAIEEDLAKVDGLIEQASATAKAVAERLKPPAEEGDGEGGQNKSGAASSPRDAKS